MQLADVYPSSPGESIYAWLWARTVRCPNPACGIETVLATSWDLSRKAGEEAWREGLAMAGQLVAALREIGAGGVYVMPQFGRYDLAAEVVEAARAT